MKRILLKISGEAFWRDGKGLDISAISKVADMIHKIQKQGHEIVVVVWWGNIYRGSSLIAQWLRSADSHNMSMLSTVFNATTLHNVLSNIGVKSAVMDALGVEFLEKYSAIQAREKLSCWEVVICSSWTGSPYFTTDTGGIIRSLETWCECLIKLTQVDGVYDSDPKTNPEAKRFDEISYDEVIAKDLKIFDQTGIIIARDNSLPLYVAQLHDVDNVLAVVSGDGIKTKIWPKV